MNDAVSPQCLLTLEMMLGCRPRRAAAVRALAQLPPPCTCNRRCGDEHTPTHTHTHTHHVPGMPGRICMLHVDSRNPHNALHKHCRPAGGYLQRVCSKLLVRVWERSHRRKVVHPATATAHNLDWLLRLCSTWPAALQRPRGSLMFSLGCWRGFSFRLRRCLQPREGCLGCHAAV